jgi:Tfp pilus assembly protein PilV
MKPTYNLQSGMSIVEVLVALFIIVAALVLYQAALNSILLTRNTRDQDLAVKIASNQLESLRTGGYSAVPVSGPFSNSQLSLLPSGAGSLSVTTFNTKTKQVTATVTWTESNSNQHSVSLSTLITETGGLK